MKVAVIFFGLPAAGKTTHARLLAEAIGAVQIETSALIQQAFESGRETDCLDDGSIIDLAVERKCFSSGELNDSRWVSALLKRTIAEAAETGRSIIFSGAMRKQVETEALMPFLDELYGRGRCVAVFLEVPEAVAAERLRARGRSLDEHSSLRFLRFRQETLPSVNYLSDHWGVSVLHVTNTHPVEFVQRVLYDRLVRHFGGDLCAS